MPRFAKMIADGMESRGHRVEMWSPKAFFFRSYMPATMQKWLGYIDQYVIFPVRTLSRLSKYPPETLFVFSDQALGPWVPLVKNRPHVIHCHDFLAQYSAEDKIAENKTSWSGKQYQAFIRSGYRSGKNFISVSQKTQDDLHNFLGSKANISEVVYNGVNPLFKREDTVKSRSRIEEITGIDVKNGYLLHVGGNQWYKNRKGVIEIYNAWRSISEVNLPLLMIGERPDASLLAVSEQSSFNKDIHFLSNVKDDDVKFAYSGASLFLFPSLAEGFGWPIVEAMASGCMVITTNEAPMSEVAGDAAYMIPRRASGLVGSWAENAAREVKKILMFSEEDKNRMKAKSLSHASSFNQTTALDKIEKIYLKVIKKANSG